MRFVVIGLVFAFFTGLVATTRHQSAQLAPSSPALQAAQAGQTFVSYSNAVAAFQRSNPTFVESVSPSQLSAQGTPFNGTFLASAGNAITAFGTAGRTITAFAALPTSSINTIVSATDGDASFGISSGATWTSIAQNATAQPLATAVPSGNVVSVIQIGH